ncbi:MAG: L-aspartate oxidase [Clostridiales bacterium]|nr:L-aspartate oxidase [Clostridiales bacterium]
MKKKSYDAIIVGTGVAGLYAALQLPKQVQVLIITKDEIENCDSYLAQGGICVQLSDEDFEPYFEDTMRAGRYENREESVRIMIESSRGIIQNLMDYGVDFDRNPDGTLSYTREGAHSAYRILHHQDVTGKAIMTTLIDQVKKCENIQIETFTTMVDLLMDEEGCHGIAARRQDGQMFLYYSKAVVLATGGLGGLFINSTNFPHITGDSFAIAKKHGILLENIPYIQIHPTVLYSKKKGRRFLISESVRGEGACLLNEKGERFVDELLPRDVVTDAIRSEMEKSGTDHVYIDMTKIPKEEILSHFPNIYERCMEEGYDVTKEKAPVVPAQHYLMGGIHTGTSGETSVPHLYAVGETACNGVHGANRLASNSLLESLVFASRADKRIVQDDLKKDICEIPVDEAFYASLQAEEEMEKLEKEYRILVLSEIRSQSPEFYDKWCKHRVKEELEP